MFITTVNILRLNVILQVSNNISLYGYLRYTIHTFPHLWRYFLQIYQAACSSKGWYTAGVVEYAQMCIRDR